MTTFPVPPQRPALGLPPIVRFPGGIICLAALLVWSLSSAIAAARPDAAGGSFAAHCDDASPELRADWQRWSRQNVPIGPDGVDFAPIKKLAASEPATAERMLRLGLSLCDPIAAQAVTVTKLRALQPDLKALLREPAGNGGSGGSTGLVRAVGAPGAAAGRLAAFRVDVVRAANAVDPATDYAAYLVPLLSDRDRNVRISAVVGARRFHKEGVTAALLDTIRRDKEHLVRYHAAQSLLELGDIYPRDVADHRRVFDALSGPLDGAPTPRDFDRYALAARMLEKMMADRAAGKCSEAVRPTSVHGDLVQVGERAVAIAVDAAESSCAREFALVVFVEAARAGRWAVSGVETTQDPATIEITTPNGPATFEYARAAGVARLGDRATVNGENTLVLSVASDGRVTAKWVGRLDTKVARGGDVVQSLLRQSPALRAAIR
jgi:hypothetical protein